MVRNILDLIIEKKGANTLQPTNIISKITNEMIQLNCQGKRCLFVFDLDSTLFDVSPRIQHILRELSAEADFLNSHPEKAQKMQKALVNRNDWGFDSALKRLDIEAPPKSDLHKLVQNYWAPRFFSNEYLIHDEPYEGAVDFVNKIYEHHLNEIVYLTGRDIHRMLQGTRDSLIRHGFPVESERAHLVLKDHHAIEDTLYKSGWFHNIEKAGFERIYFFENEPLNIEIVRREHPEIQIIFFESTHSGKTTSPVDLPVIYNFKI